MGSFKLEEQTNNTEVEEIISAGQLQKILNTNAVEVTKLCQKACLKPKKDGLGNIYFSKSDIDVLKKVKELYEHTRRLQESRQRSQEQAILEMEEEEQQTPAQNAQSTPNIAAGNFLTRAKSRARTEIAVMNSSEEICSRLDNMEYNIVSKISDLMSEKMDGLDEVVVELIRSKTENESLRQRLNELNKENFNLKNENASYKAVGLGFYIKKNTDDFVL